MIAGSSNSGSTDISFRWSPVLIYEERFGTSSLWLDDTRYRVPAIKSYAIVDVLDAAEKSVGALQRPALFY